jgi:hypothetical protein
MEESGSDSVKSGGELAWKCDFCGGSPACIPECVTAALTRKGDS